MNGKNIIELKQERATITNSIRALMNEYNNKEMPQDKKDELTKIEARFDTINDSILREEKQLERERVIGEAKNNDEMKNKDTGKDKEIKAAFAEYIINGNKAAFDAYAALQQDNPTQAGYLVAPEKFVMELIKDIDNSLFFRQIAKVLPPLKGAKSLGYPKRTARAARAVWGTEISAPTPDNQLAFGKREFKPRAATAEILVSKTLIQNAPEVDSIVRAELAFAFGELLEIAYLTGDGADKPLGIFTATTDGISTARDVSTDNTATAMTFDGLINAKYSIKEQYQARLQWMFHRDAVKQLAKIKDTEGQYVWIPAITENTPDILLGKRVKMSEYVPNTFTSGLYVGAIGDFSNYWIVDSINLEIQALMELAARTNQVDYIARLETDGAPVLEEAFARVKLG